MILEKLSYSLFLVWDPVYNKCFSVWGPALPGNFFSQGSGLGRSILSLRQVWVITFAPRSCHVFFFYQFLGPVLEVRITSIKKFCKILFKLVVEKHNRGIKLQHAAIHHDHSQHMQSFKILEKDPLLKCNETFCPEWHLFI